MTKIRNLPNVSEPARDGLCEVRALPVIMTKTVTTPVTPSKIRGYGCGPEIGRFSYSSNTPRNLLQIQGLGPILPTPYFTTGRASGIMGLTGRRVGRSRPVTGACSGRQNTPVARKTVGSGTALCHWVAPGRASHRNLSGPLPQSRRRSRLATLNQLRLAVRELRRVCDETPHFTSSAATFDSISAYAHNPRLSAYPVVDVDARRESQDNTLATRNAVACHDRVAGITRPDEVANHGDATFDSTRASQAPGNRAGSLRRRRLLLLRGAVAGVPKSLRTRRRGGIEALHRADPPSQRWQSREQRQEESEVVTSTVSQVVSYERTSSFTPYETGSLTRSPE